MEAPAEPDTAADAAPVEAAEPAAEEAAQSDPTSQLGLF
jgi:hypothetical protein